MSRADRVADLLAERSLDLLLVTNLVNVRYLTGYTGSNGIAIVGRDVRRFITDFRYVEQAAVEVEGFDREQASQDLVSGLAEGWPDGELRLGFEDDNVTVRRHERMREVLPDRIELVAAGGIVESLRAVKEPEEIERIAAAAALADEVYGVLREQGLVGRTEREVAFALENEMRRRGAEPGFESIVASAERGALPHAQPTDVPIARGTLVTLDIGARVDGYHSDCTRTWATGELPDDLARGLRGGPARAAGGRWMRSGPALRGARSTRSRARSSRRPATATTSATGSDTASAWRSTRARGWRAPRRRGWRRATSSPSSPASTCRAAEGCGSRTSWWSPRTAAGCSPAPPRT